MIEMIERTYSTSKSLNDNIDLYAEIQGQGAASFRNAIQLATTLGSSDIVAAVLAAWESANKENLQAYSAHKALALFQSDDQCVKEAVAKAVSDTKSGVEFNAAVAGEDSFKKQIGKSYTHAFASLITKFNSASRSQASQTETCDESQTRNQIAAYMLESKEVGTPFGF